MIFQSLRRRSIITRAATITAVAGLALTCLAFLVPGPIQREAYMGPEYCGACHQDTYKAWQSSAHAKASIHCESCHGPGQYYGALHIKKDAVLSKLLFKQDKINCLHCHSQEQKIGARVAGEKFDHARSK